MKKTALITGVEGFIGSHLVNFLQAKGWNVVGTHRPHSHQPGGSGSTVSYVQCDLRNGQRVEQILADYKPTHIFHMAAQSLPTISWADPVETFESNIMGTLYLLEAARRQETMPVVVSACSSAEYGRVPASAIPVTEAQPLQPLHPYGISKVCQDLLARQYFLDYGLPAVNIRLFNTTGPGKTNDAPSDFVRQLVRIQRGLQPPLIEVGNLKPRRAFLDVQDTVAGFYLAAMKGKRGEAYNLCATRTHAMSEVLRMAIRISGVKVKIVPAAHLMRPSDEKVIFGSAKKVLRDTGWKPKLALEQTLQSMFAYWKNLN